MKIWIVKFSNEGKEIGGILSNNSLIVWNFNLNPFEISLVIKKLIKLIIKTKKEV